MRTLVLLLWLSLLGLTLAEELEVANPDLAAPPRPFPVEQSLGRKEAPVRLTLEQAMERVISEAPSVDKIASQIREAEYRVEEAFTQANPRIDFSAQYFRVEPAVAFPGGGPVINPADNYEFRLVLRQTISNFGRMKWGALAAKLSRRTSQEEYRAELHRLIALVARRYIQALLAAEELKIAEDELEARLASLRQSQLLFEEGTVARFDVLRNSAAASQAQQTLLEAETREHLARAQVLSLMNEDLSTKLELTELSIESLEENETLTESKLSALEYRPDLRALRWALESAKARVKLAKAGNNPTLELQNTTVNRNATGFAPGTQNTTALVLSIPLFDGGVSRTQRLQAEEVVKQLVSDIEEAERNVVLSLEQLHRQLQDRWRAISVAQENVDQSEEALRVAVLRYENGVSTNVELLDSQASRTRARFQLAQAKSNFLQSRWDWWEATAGEFPVEVPLSVEMRERLGAQSPEK